MSGSVEHQEIHSCRMHGVLDSFKKFGFNERFQRPGNFLDVVSHKRCELFARQERARMPVQEHQQIEVAGASHYRRPAEETSNVLRVGVKWVRDTKPPRNAEACSYTTIAARIQSCAIRWPAGSSPVPRGPTVWPRKMFAAE